MCRSILPHDIAKTDAANVITKRDKQMFQGKSGKRIYFGVKEVKDQGHVSQKDIAGVGLCTFVLAQSRYVAKPSL